MAKPGCLVKFEAKDRKEADAMRLALSRADVRAFVTMIGYLDPLTPRGRKRVLDFVADTLNEESGRIRLETRQ